VSGARAAATILLVRDGVDGLEVFMVQRHRRSGFLPNAWVFPGGRVDPADALHDHPAVIRPDALAAAFGVAVPEATALGVAGVRETFEEAGVWLGDGALPAALRQGLHSGDVALGAALTAHGAAIALDRVSAWSWWVTPEAEPRRYDTRFLIAAAPPGEARHDEHETVDSRWVNVAAAVANQDLSAFPLAPPTWWTLHELAEHDAAAAALATHRPAERAVQPIMEFVDTGIRLVLPGHAQHPAPAVPGLPDEITYDGGWIAWRAGRQLTPAPRARAGS